MPKTGWKATLAAVLKEHNTSKVDGSVASYATQDKRADILFAGFKELRELGYKLDSVQQFKGKHMEALAKLWEGKGLSPSTIQNNISTFRTFSGWIGKVGMVETAAKYVSEGAASRSSITTEEKSWSAKGVDAPSKIHEVRAIDQRVALQLELQSVFGLRVRESLQLRPHVADKGQFLTINAGTKGGRDRVVPIDTPQKRELIDRAKTFAASKMASTSDPNKTLAQVKNHYYAVVRQAGITRENGITSHGLRHDYANTRYEQISGVAGPLRGGDLADTDRDADRAARLELSEELGHSREDVTTHYLGR